MAFWARQPSKTSDFLACQTGALVRIFLGPEAENEQLTEDAGRADIRTSRRIITVKPRIGPMKTLALRLLILASAVTAHAQGTFEFANINVAGGPNAPVYLSDRVTKLSGPQFMAELLIGATEGNLASIATTGFLTGNGAGYFDGPYQTVPGITPGVTAFVQVDVWNTQHGTTFLQAQASGLPDSWWQSSVFPLTAGGGSFQPSPPTQLTGLGNSPVYLNSVPEPSALAVFSCGLALALLKKGLTRQSTE